MLIQLHEKVRCAANPALIGAALLFAGRDAYASHAEVELDYTRLAGAESCPGQEQLRTAVAARLGYDPFVVGGDHEVIVVRIARVGGGLEGSIERRDAAHATIGKAARIVSKSADCTELTSSLAVGSVSETSAVCRGVAGGQPLEEPSERLAAAFSRAPCVAHSA